MTAPAQPEIVLGVTGSIGAYKAAEIVRRLRDHGCVVRCVMTAEAQQFLTPLTLQALSGQPVSTELFDRSDIEIAHTTLADRTHLVLIAPATANVIAKLAHGFADDALTCLVLATTAPVLLAPAMNVHMYRHPMTQQNLKQVRRLGYHVVGPDIGQLACGYEAIGHLADPEQIVQAALRLARPPSKKTSAPIVDGSHAPAVARRGATPRRRAPRARARR